LHPSHHLGGNSRERVEAIMALERVFDIEVPDDGARRLRAVQEGIDFINQCKKGRR
jgi:acyl carrier protein